MVLNRTEDVKEPSFYSVAGWLQLQKSRSEVTLTITGLIKTKAGKTISAQNGYLGCYSMILNIAVNMCYEPLKGFFRTYSNCYCV